MNSDTCQHCVDPKGDRNGNKAFGSTIQSSGILIPLATCSSLVVRAGVMC